MLCNLLLEIRSVSRDRKKLRIPKAELFILSVLFNINAMTGVTNDRMPSPS